MLMALLYFLNLMSIWLKKLSDFSLLLGISWYLKVNFAKSELIPLNISHSRAQHFAHILGCDLGKLQIKYLEIFLHWKAHSKKIWMNLIHKIQSRLQIWKDKFLSLDDRVFLLNSVLSSIPLYYLSIYRLSSWCLNKINRIRKFSYGQGLMGVIKGKWP
jgi:hypothetical protein